MERRHLLSQGEAVFKANIAHHTGLDFQLPETQLPLNFCEPAQYIPRKSFWHLGVAGKHRLQVLRQRQKLPDLTGSAERDRDSLVSFARAAAGFDILARPNGQHNGCPSWLQAPDFSSTSQETPGQRGSSASGAKHMPSLAVPRTRDLVLAEENLSG